MFKNNPPTHLIHYHHSSIAEYLILSNTKTKAKSVGNIISRLKKKGYIETVTTHNYNGKNGGSSTAITVNETFLEAQLHAIFNPVEELHQNMVQAKPVLGLEPVKMQLETATPPTSPSTEILAVDTKNVIESDEDFIAFMQADNNEPRPIPDLPCLAKTNNYTHETENMDSAELDELGKLAKSIDNVDTFKHFLQELLTRRLMISKKERLQFIIDQQSYNLEKMKGAFEALILKTVE